MYFPADFSENEINTEYKPCFGNYAKECSENNKIYQRNMPLDNINKNNLLQPRPLSTSKCNLEEYNRQCYLFPPKTENIIKKYGDDLDSKYCHQNFVNIDDESFLLNINKPLKQDYEGNIKQPVANMFSDQKKISDSFTFVKDEPELLLDEYSFRDFINVKTKRRDMVKITQG